MKKTMFYRRAIWVNEVDYSLFELLDSVLDQIGENILPTFNLSSGEDCMLARRHYQEGGHFLHFVTYEEGAPAAVINT